jgi:hypothetical protein
MWLKYLVPTASAADLRKAAGLAVVGALIAGGFGAIHDQVTYTISPEYFTRLKFVQFRWADLGFPARVFVSEIGFLATWWVGLIAAWFLARLALLKFTSPGKRVMWALAAMVGMTSVCAVVGYFCGPHLLASRRNWIYVLPEMGVTDQTAFCRVAAIHLGSYAGALVGWCVTMMVFWKARR